MEWLEERALLTGFGQSIAGVLEEPGSERLFELDISAGELGKPFSVVVDGDGTLRPRLELLAPDGAILATGPTGSFRFDTRIKDFVPRTVADGGAGPGTYRLRVTPFTTDVGFFELGISDRPVETPTPIGFSEFVPGRLDHTGDEDLYTFSALADDTVTIRLDGSGFSPDFSVQGPAGFVAATGNNDTNVTMTLPADGQYTVVVTGGGPDSLGNGPYLLSVSDPRPAATPIGFGQRARGEIAPDVPPWRRCRADSTNSVPRRSNSARPSSAGSPAAVAARHSTWRSMRETRCWSISSSRRPAGTGRGRTGNRDGDVQGWRGQSADSRTVVGGEQDQNFGGRNIFGAGEDPSPSAFPRRSLVRFDVASLAGRFDTIESVTLRLYPAGVSVSTSDVLQLFRVSEANAGWIEGTEVTAVGGESPDTGMSTWNNRVEGSEPWAGSSALRTPGTDFTELLGSRIFDAATLVDSPLDIELDPALVQGLISDWSTGVNAGMLLVAEQEQNNIIAFHSSEAADPSFYPELIVTFAPSTEPGSEPIAPDGSALSRQTSPLGDVDQFTFTAQQGQAFNLSVDAVTGGLDLDARIYDSLGVVRGSATSDNDAVISNFVAPADDTYTIRVEPGGSTVSGTVDNTGDYTISLEAIVTSANLAVTDVTPPSQPGIQSGDTVPFSFTVENAGNEATAVSNWFDRVVLSRNGTYGDGDDIELGLFERTGGLGTGEAYTANVSGTIPAGVSGDFFVLVETDATGVVSELSGEADNIGAAAATFHVDLAQYPDLIVEDLRVDVGGGPPSDLVIGGWDASRGGSFSVPEGIWYEDLRTAIQTALPASSITSSDTLTSAYLSTLNVLVIGSVKEGNMAITPLSADEQMALIDFVGAGGTAVILVDNNALSDASHESLLDPFGLDVSGSLSGDQTITVTDPTSHPITDGPYGIVSTVSTGFPGWIDDLGPNARALGTLDANGQTALAVIDAGTLTLASGTVLFVSDTFVAANEALFLNTIALARQASADAGNALSLDGDDDFVALPALNPLTTAATFEAWVRPLPSPSVNGGTVFARRDPFVKESFSVLIGNDGRLVVILGTTTIFAKVYASPAGVIRFGGYQHLAVTFDSTTGLVAGTTYSRQERFTLPTNVSGVFRAEITTNANGNLFELGATGNNTMLDDVPTAVAFDAAYQGPLAPNQAAVVPSTEPGKYFVLVRGHAEPADDTPVRVLARVLPFGIIDVVPDVGGDSKFVTTTILGAQFKEDAIVKLVRPGIQEIEPERFEVVDSTKIIAIFDLTDAPHGLYDVAVINPNGDQAVVPYRYLIERALEPDISIGMGARGSWRRARRDSMA